MCYTYLVGTTVDIYDLHEADSFSVEMCSASRLDMKASEFGIGSDSSRDALSSGLVLYVFRG